MSVRQQTLGKLFLSHLASERNCYSTTIKAALDVQWRLFVPTMSRNASLSATNIAVHHHLNCDLYVHNVYWQGTSRPNPDFKSTVPKHKLDSELLRAQFKRGTDWEDNLDRWLDDSDLLLRVPTVPLEIDTLIENIQADERDHFFIANLTFFPPQDNLNKKFHEIGSTPVKFGLAKPDLLEITRISGGVKWKVIDAKASKTVKVSYRLAFYDNPPYVDAYGRLPTMYKYISIRCV